MRKLILACSLAFALSGCAALQSYFGGIATATPSQLITDAQNASVAVCQFLPTAETVANLIATGNPILATASQIANAICAAVAPHAASAMAADIPLKIRLKATRRSLVPTVSGVPIHGQFIH